MELPVLLKNHAIHVTKKNQEASNTWKSYPTKRKLKIIKAFFLLFPGRFSGMTSNIIGLQANQD
jgi:hypothetical protein